MAHHVSLRGVVTVVRQVCSQFLHIPPGRAGLNPMVTSPDSVPGSDSLPVCQGMKSGPRIDISSIVCQNDGLIVCGWLQWS